MYGTAYHATCRRFKSFDLSFALANTFLGKGVYMSSCVNDCVHNYNNRGIDRDNQIWYLKETTQCTTIQARNRLGLNHGRSFLLTCKFTLKNPFFLSKGKYTYSDFNLKEVNRFCEANPDPRNEAIIKGVSLGYSNDSLFSEYKRCEEDEKDFYRKIEHFNRFLRWFGFDGYIQDIRSYIPRMPNLIGDVLHYVVFDPKNILISKSETI